MLFLRSQDVANASLDAPLCLRCIVVISEGRQGKKDALWLSFRMCLLLVAALGCVPHERTTTVPQGSEGPADRTE